MAVSVSLSTRVSPELRERLIMQASARRMTLGELARELLAAGTSGSGREGDGPLVNEVRCVFAHLPPDAGLRREVCLALARTAESGGSAGIAAGKELIVEVGVAQRLYEPEFDDEDYEDLLRASDQGGEPGCGVG